MADSEHIFLESDERVVPTLETARRIHARVKLHGGLWRRSMELALIDGLFLAVRITRANSLSARYVVDLRFVDPVPRLERRIAWRSIAMSAGCLALGIFGTRDLGLLVTAALFGIAAAALFAAFHLTTESLTLFSANGRARLVAHTGRVGTIRAFRKYFLPRLDAHLRVAIGARRGALARHLRDEMREHFRLRTAGALSEAEYETAKQRILATHAPTVTRAEMAGATSRRASAG